jgi:hypothetical protein
MEQGRWLKGEKPNRLLAFIGLLEFVELKIKNKFDKINRIYRIKLKGERT